MKELKKAIGQGMDKINAHLPGKNQFPTSPILTAEEIEGRLDAVLEANPNDHRTQTYAQVLYNLPEGTLSNARKILEVGMNNRLLLFREVLRPDIHLYGVTLEKDHAEAARRAGQQHGIKTNVTIHNVDSGLPRGFDQMDLILDIYSATHYAEENPLPKYVKALKPGGVVAVVPGGGFLRGMAEYAREHPENDGQGALPYVAFRYTEGEGAVAFAEIPVIARMIRQLGYPSLRENPTDQEIMACIEDMAKRLGHKVVTNLDLDSVLRINEMEDLGLVDVRLFETADGTASVGKKPVG